MRNAPSVLYPVGRCAFYGSLLVSLGVLGLAAWAAAAWYARRPDGGASLTVASWVVGGLWLSWACFAGWSWLRSPVGQLQWESRAASTRPQAAPGAWRWRSEAYQDGAVLRRVELVLDLQNRVLLRLHNPDAAASWVWLDQRSDPARWDDLRRALLAHA